MIAGHIGATQRSFSCVLMQDGLSPVYAASGNGHTEVVDLLVQAGADIHLATTEVHKVSSSIAAVVDTNFRFIVVYDLDSPDHTHKRGNIVLGWMAQSLFYSMSYVMYCLGT